MIKTPVTEKNNVHIKMNLHEENGELKGNTQIIFRGYSGDFIRGIQRQTGNINYGKFIHDYLQSLVSLNEYNGISTEVSDDSVVIKCGVTVSSSMITKIQGKSYIQMNFIPFIHGNFPSAGSEDLLIDYIVSDQADITIDLQKPITAIKFNPFGINGDPFFSINAEFSGTRLFVHYSFLIKNIDSHPCTQKTFFKCLENVAKTFNNAIVAETKD
jgi:hypothetical protein